MSLDRISLKPPPLKNKGIYSRATPLSCKPPPTTFAHLPAKPPPGVAYTSEYGIFSVWIHAVLRHQNLKFVVLKRRQFVNKDDFSWKKCIHVHVQVHVHVLHVYMYMYMYMWYL